MKILEEQENSLLNRKEVKIIIESQKNPSFEEATKLLAEKFKASEDLIAVKGVKGKFGMDTFLISAHLYKNKEDKARLEKKKEKKAAEAGK